MLSGPGPAFIYRIGARHLRACLDVPSGVPRGTEQAAYLWNAYGRALPEALRPAFRRALESRPIMWAANYFRPRANFATASGLSVMPSPGPVGIGSMPSASSLKRGLISSSI